MIRCGELCQSCYNFCSERIDEANAIEIECVQCDGTGSSNPKTDCESCKGKGVIEITSCPKAMIDSEIMDAINLSTLAEKGFLPEHGGLLDQDSFWLNVWMRLARDTSKIEQEQRARQMAKWQAT